MNGDAIQFRGLSKTYRTGFWGKKHQALTDLNLNVPMGSIFGFLGANGAGKTTTIKILMGIQHASTGSVEVFATKHLDPEVKRRIGYLPERPAFHGELTANEFLDFHRRLYGALPSTRRARANAELLQLVGLANQGDRLIREFSKGMQQRIGIAQALVCDPDLVILDEPMSGLDPVGRRDVRLLINQLASEGKTVFFSTHILSDVETLCDRLAFLEKGVLHASGTIDEILKSRSRFAKEIVFDQISEDLVNKNSLLRTSIRFGRAWKLQIAVPDQVQPSVEAIWQNKGQLISISSPQLSLEAALFPVEESK